MPHHRHPGYGPTPKEALFFAERSIRTMRARCALAALLLALLAGAATAQSDLQYFTACPPGVNSADVVCNPTLVQVEVGQELTFATQRGNTYNNSMRYALVALAPPGHKVIATITAFDTEQDYDLFAATGLAQSLSGANLLLPYTIKGDFDNPMALQLTADYDIVRKGVTLTLRASPCTRDAPLELLGTCFGAAACPAGTFASLATGSCEYCPAGTASAAVGAASAAACTPCAVRAGYVPRGSTICPVLFTSCPTPGVCLGQVLTLAPSATSTPTLAVTQANASFSPTASYYLTVAPPPGFGVKVRIISSTIGSTDFLVATTGTAGPFTLEKLSTVGPIFMKSGATLEGDVSFTGYLNSPLTLQLLPAASGSGSSSGVILALSLEDCPSDRPFSATVGFNLECFFNCPEGTYVSGDQTCGLCPLGTYAFAPTSGAPTTAAAACKPCPSGTTSVPGALTDGLLAIPASGACLVVLGAASDLLQPPALALTVPLPPLRFTTQAGPVYDVGGSYALVLLPPPGYFLSITLSVDLSSAEFMYPGDAFAVLAGNASAFPASPATLALPAIEAISPNQYNGPFSTPVTLMLLSVSAFAQRQGVQGSIELLPQSCSGAAPLGVIGTSNCLAACPVGAWQSSPSACTQCPASFFGTAPGASSAAVCSQCPAGASSLPGASACTPCPLQHFRTPGMTACSACAAGSISASTGAHACAPCPPGTGNGTTSAGAPTCVPCALGSYRGASMAVCTACPPGSIGDASASPAACALCPSGRYSANALQCLPCAPGTHAPVAGSAQCVPCTAAACGAAYQATMRTLAGGRSGFRNGRAARFNSSLDVEVDSGSGTVFVADT